MAHAVLVVDDERQMRDLLRLYLSREGLVIDEAVNGRDALSKLQQRRYSVMILDLMMPEMDGWEVCRRVRQTSLIPILVLTARGDVDDRVLGLNLGADDYLTKPFDPRELVARVQVLLRRHRTEPSAITEPGVLRHGALAIDPATRQVTFRGESLALTPKEFDLLYYLAQNPGRVFTREQLLEQVWGMSFFGETRTVDSHVKNVRDKLGDPETGKSIIATVWGVGYKFERTGS